MREDSSARPRRGRAFGCGIAAAIGCALAAPANAELPQPCAAGCGPGVWVASDPARAPVVSRETMVVDQIADRETFHWQNFDVGADASVTFQQPSSSAIALNRIYDGDPSQILGTVSANGQIYLLNPNGIVFGAGSQIDAHSLVASSLDLPDDIFNGAGIVNAINQTSTGRAAFESAGGAGPIITEPGATLRAQNGGRILIIAPEIEHGGRIETPEGQTILAAASDRVYLAAADDPNLRGLLVEVDSGGSIDNLGEIIAERGNVSLVGLAVNQAGRIRATTSVNLNGSVRLLARDSARVVTEEANVPIAYRAGTLTLAADSVTEVAPEIDSTETAPDAQPQLRSNVELVGHAIHLAAIVSAPGGEVAITATTTPDSPATPNRAPNDSQVIIGAGAIIDVSGTDTTVLPVTRNVVEVELRANELRDAPLQRDGALRGKKVAVDIREGTPLADVSGAIDAVRRGVGERTAAGGHVSVRSEGDFVLEQGATIDFSGGAISYTGGVIETTRLLSEGRVIDIADATPDLVYDGIFTPVTVQFKKWGISETYAPFGAVPAGYFEAGYVEGKDAGTLELLASGAVIDGELLGGITIGANQRLPAAVLAGNAVRPYDQVPVAGSLVIGDPGQIDAATPDFRTPDVRFTTSRAPASVTASPPAIDLEVALSQQLIAASGIGNLAIYSNGRISVPDDVTLALPPGGSLALTAGVVKIDGDIAITSGSVALSALPTLDTPFGAAQLSLGATNRIDVRGAWINETPVLNPEGAFGPVFIDGGTVALAAEGALVLAHGSAIDVSGGAWLDPEGSLVGGAGGAIAIELDFLDALPLRLDGTLRGDALDDGGSLSITGSGFRIRNGAATAADLLDATYAVLPVAWFRDGGFDSYELTSTHTGIVIEADTALDLVARNRVLNPAYAVQPAGSDLTGFSRLATLPADARRPVDLTLRATSGDGLGQLPIGITIEKGARITTDPGGAIGLWSDTSIAVDGTLAAPGGIIDLTVTADPGLELGYRPDQAIWLGASARLLAPAAATPIPDDRGLRRAEIHAGGEITLRALRGYVIADPGSVLDVAGQWATLDLAIDTGAINGSGTLVATEVAADAGTITLQAREGVLLGATLRGAPAPIAGAAGGSLNLILEPNLAGATAIDPTLPQFPTGPRDIVIGAGYDGALNRGEAVPASYNGLALIAPAVIEAGAFDSVTLRAVPAGSNVPAGPDSLGRIIFTGASELSPRRALVLDAPIIEAIAAGEITLASSYVALGAAAPQFGNDAAASAGNATLAVTADLIDLVGTVALRGLGGADLPAITLGSRGDIRLRGEALPSDPAAALGELRAAGDLALTAQRVYPTTRSVYALRAPEAAITIDAAGAEPTATPWSAGATLTLNAARIAQRGAIYAPFGSIKLNASESLLLAPGSLTATSGGDEVLLFGQTEFATDWVYPLSGRTEVITALPEKRIALSGPEIDFSAGAVVDVAGGGDLLAYEFVPGPGGSTDLLRSDNASGAFAIVPSLGAAAAPLTPLESPGFPYPVGSTVELAGGAGSLDGEFTILPARYALLPGAYLLTPITGRDDLAPGQTITRTDGGVVVPGRFAVANTDIVASRWSGYLVYDGAEVRQRAEYLETRASSHFATSDSESPLPADAGAVTVSAEDNLALRGSLPSAGTTGRGVRLDVSARDLAVVGEHDPTSARIELRDADLNALGAESILLGGIRSITGAVTTIATTATTVTIESDAALRLPELLLTATDNIAIASGARVEAAGQLGDRTEAIALSGAGAFARIAAGASVAIEREPTDSAASSGSVVVAAGAVLTANAIALDATLDTIVAGEIGAAGALTLGASRISLGDAPGSTSGLVLDAASLAGLRGELRLASRTTIDLYGDFVLPTAIETLQLDTAAIRGFDAQATLAAGSIALRNSGASLATETTAGGGRLELNATILRLDTGALAITGFATTRFTADAGILAGGGFDLTLDGDFAIDTPVIAGDDGASLAIAAAGDFTLENGKGTATPTAFGGIGATLAVSASRIELASAILLPSGSARFEALAGAGDLVLREGARIDVAGRDEIFADVTFGAPGGDVTLRATDGAVRLLAGSVIDVSGAPAGGDAGRLTMRSAAMPQFDGGFHIAGAGVRTGSFALDAATLPADGFSVLNAALQAGSFSNELDLRVRTGDLAITATEVVRAGDVAIVVDAGMLELAGTIDAASTSGGRVRLAAGGDLIVHDGATLDARALAGDGGSIALATRDGSVDLGVATIDVSGNTGEIGGTVRITAPRQAGSDLAIARFDATVQGADRVEMVGDARYTATTVGESLRATVIADTDSWLTDPEATFTRLGVAGDARMRLLPGIEIVSPADLSLASDWDLMSWRYGDEAGVLTLRAAGDLLIDGALSDGILHGVDTTGFGTVRDVVATGRSWSYRLAAGADLASADALGVVTGAGDAILGTGGRVQTGTGSIDVAAGGSVVFAADDAVLMTVGESRGAGLFGLGDIEVLGEIMLGGDFVWRGGDIRVRALGDVLGRDSGQFLSQWQPRVGGVVYLGGDTIVLPSAWGIDAGAFRQNVGALGGGDVAIRAAGDIRELSVMLPNNGKPAGAADPGIARSGDARIEAGGDLLGGMIFVADGIGSIRAGGTVDASGPDRAATILALASGTLAVSARRAVHIETVLNPTVIPNSASQGFGQDLGIFADSTYFFTYGASGTVDLTSVAGDIVLRNDVSGASPIGVRVGQLAGDANARELLRVYPATLRAQSLRGDFVLNGSLSLFPSATGDLRLLADEDVVAEGGYFTVLLNLSDADPALLPTPRAPVGPETLRIDTLHRFNPDRSDLSHAATPVHRDDTRLARIVAREGIVGSRELPLSLVSAKPLAIDAGGDIVNATVRVQHAAPRDTSSIRTGGSIRFPKLRAPSTGTFTPNTSRIEVAGPGRLELIAGADIDLGTSSGILSVGDTYNPALPDTGADITLFAGMGGSPDYAAFADRFLATDDRYHVELAAFRAELGLAADGANWAAQFADLSIAEQQAFLRRVLFLELQESGVAAASGAAPDFDPGFDAIATLFPAAGRGDISLLLSRISTFDGGDIDLFAPGGNINAGVTATDRIAKGPAELGIVAQRDGDIRALLDGDFLVNQSRVFALDGGDILIWASRGDIDAGRGAKTAIASPPPTITFDAQGNAVVEFPAAVAGSGIRASVATSGRAPGNVYLFAPAGVVSAGDAGIGSAGNITIGAVEVIGADNIDIGGVAVGVPQADLGGIGAGLVGVGDLASAASSQATAQATERAQAAAAESLSGLGGSAFAVVTVEVIGFGE